MNEQLERIAEFLSEYMTTKDGKKMPPDPKYCQDGVRLLIKKDVFTKEELKAECLKQYLVIIPEYMFEDSQTPVK